ncbi:MAG: MATE family efflux transporter [Armatimonadetes bacterium]|nr:MATE family efflux transporter [Armatimonadota bacterium]
MSSVSQVKESSELRESPARIVWALAWPAVALNLLQTVNSLLDSFFVQHLEQANLTALGASTIILFLFISLSFALSTAATAFVSRAFGAKDHDGYREANQKCLGLSLAAGVLFGLLSASGAKGTAALLLPADAVLAKTLMVRYLSIFSLGLPAYCIVHSLAGSLRGIGDTKSPMVISSLQIGVHIVLNLLLVNGRQTYFGMTVHGLGWGIAGAGTAMTVSAWVAAIVYFAWAAKTPLGSCWRCSWPGLEWSKRILNVAVPAGMMAVVRVTSLAAFTKVLSQVPQAEAAIGALRPSFSIESLAFMPAFGLSVSAAALVGQSLGMARPDRAEKLGWTASNHAAIVSLAASAVLILWAPNVAGLIVPDQPLIAHYVARYLQFICLTEVLFAYGMVLTGAMQGAGDTVRPFWMTLVAMWGVRVPLAALLALPVGLGADGCWMALSATQALQGILAMLMFRQGRWKLTKV